VDKAQIRAIQLVEARAEAAKVLEVVETTVDEMAFAVEPGIVHPLGLGGLMRRNDRFAALIMHVGDKGSSGIAPIRDDLLEGEPFQQRRGLGAVMALPSRQARAQRIA